MQRADWWKEEQSPAHLTDTGRHETKEKEKSRGQNEIINVNDDVTESVYIESVRRLSEDKKGQTNILFIFNKNRLEVIFYFLDFILPFA